MTEDDLSSRPSGEQDSMRLLTRASLSIFLSPFSFSKSPRRDRLSGDVIFDCDRELLLEAKSSKNFFLAERGERLSERFFLSGLEASFSCERIVCVRDSRPGVITSSRKCNAAGRVCEIGASEYWSVAEVYVLCESGRYGGSPSESTLMLLFSSLTLPLRSLAMAASARESGESVLSMVLSF